MYKIIYNNQILDVLDQIQYVKYLPKTKYTILVDERQANGVISSNGSEIYHILGTKNTFADKKKSVQIEEIDKEEYDRLTTQVAKNNELIDKVKNLEDIVMSLQKLIEGR